MMKKVFSAAAIFSSMLYGMEAESKVVSTLTDVVVHISRTDIQLQAFSGKEQIGTRVTYPLNSDLIHSYPKDPNKMINILSYFYRWMLDLQNIQKIALEKPMQVCLVLPGYATSDRRGIFTSVLPFIDPQSLVKEKVAQSVCVLNDYEAIAFACGVSQSLCGRADLNSHASTTTPGASRM
jgi:hypothetical protein